jgi:hypothetical protein
VSNKIAEATADKVNVLDLILRMYSIFIKRVSGLCGLT